MKCAVLMLCAVLQARAAEPIVGKWQLKSQQVGGQETPVRPLNLRIAQSGDVLEFDYSAVNEKQANSLRFAVRLDGSDADIKDSAGQKIGTAKVTRGGPSEYLVTLLRPGRPAASGKMTLSNNGKTLVSESDVSPPGGGKIHTVQVFERQ